METDKTVDFMLEEYKQIANAYQDLHSQHNALVRSYLTLVALPFTVLAVVVKILGSASGSHAGALSDATRVAVPAIVLFMVALCAVGYSVFRALVATRAEAILYVRTVNCIRRFFVEQSDNLDLRRYLVLPDYDSGTPPFHEGSETRYFWSVITVQFLNTAISIATARALLWWVGYEMNDYWPTFVRLMPFLQTDYLIDLKWLAPLTVGAIYFFFQASARGRTLDKHERTYKPKFGPHKVLGVDLDGVLADLAERVIRKANSLFGLVVCREDITSHNIAECLGLSEEQVRSIFASDDVFEDLAPVPGSKKALSQLHKKGWIIHIVTDRFWHKNDWSISKEWLDQDEFHYDHLNLVRSNEKSNYARFNNMLYFVEDNYETALSLSNVCEKVFLLDEPYNKGTVPYNVTRIQTWDEIVGILNDVS